MEPLIWVEIERKALTHNMREFRRLIGPDCLLAPVVKANAYGHGLLLSASAFIEGGADWLCVHDIREAMALRDGGIEVPIYVLGYVAPDAMEEVVRTNARLVVYDRDVVDAAAAAGRNADTEIPLHVKIETGNNRQGLSRPAALELARYIDESAGVLLEGASTHFADVEDTTDHSYARQQLESFDSFIREANAAGLSIPIRHASNSASTILWPETHKELVRVGIAAYGMWPSKETYITALMDHRDEITLKPALTWKARIGQVKNVPAGSYVGYGCAYRTTTDTRLAIVTVGYYDGYDRRLSNQSYVLVNGLRAPVRGRVCMNLIIIDVTHVPDVEVGQEVVLLGGSGESRLSAEQLAEWIGTINYEIPTRIRPDIRRIEVD